MATKKNTGRFAALAKEATTSSILMNNRTKVDVDELYGKEVTIIGFDLMQATDNSGEQKDYAVCIFKEDPNAFFFGGKILTKICKNWLKDFDSTEEASEALEADGGVTIIMSRGKTKNGNRITNVDIV